MTPEEKKKLNEDIDREITAINTLLKGKLDAGEKVDTATIQGILDRLIPLRDAVLRAKQEDEAAQNS